MKQEVAALTDNPVTRPEKIDTEFLKPMFHTSAGVDGFLYLLVAGWRGHVAEAARATGHFAVDLITSKEFSLYGIGEEEWLAIAENLGDVSNAVKTQVRRSGKDFIVSIPVMPIHSSEFDNTHLHPGKVAKQTALFPKREYSGAPLVTTQRADSEDQYFDLLTHLIPKAYQKQFFDPSSPIDIPMASDITAGSIGLNMKQEAEWINADTIKAMKKYVMGYRLVGPEIPPQWALPDAKPGVEEIHGLKDAANPKSFGVWLAQNRTMVVMADIHLPEAFAQFIGQSHTPNPSDILVWMVAWLRHWLGGIGNHVEAVRPMSSVRASNKSKPKAKVSKASADGLMISTDGYPYYVPTVDQVDLYETQFQAFTDRDGVFTLNDVRSRKKPEVKLPVNTIIYTDWENNKLAYSDGNGMLQILDLEGWQPMSATQARKILDLPLLKSGSRTKVKHLISQFAYTMRNRTPERKLPVPETLVKAMVALGIGQYQYSQNYVEGDLVNYLTRVASGAAVQSAMSGQGVGLQEPVAEWMAAYGHDLEGVTFRDVYSWPPVKWIGDGLQAAWSIPSLVLAENSSEHDLEHVLQFIQTRAPVQGMEELGLLHLMNRYGSTQKAYKKIALADEAARAQYTKAKDPGYAWEPQPLPYVADERALMPHQARVDGVLTVNNPDWTVLDVDAGGGKTGIILRYILTMLKNKKVRRPAIACPGFLVKNYIEEVSYFYQGRINLIVLNTDTFGVYGEDGLREMIAKAPSNTILLTDFGFLSNPHRNRDVYYGAGVVTINLNAEFLLSLGIDSLTVDESHQLRNEDSNKSQAARKLALSMTNKTIATGTFITNQISDTAGQFALFDPSVFGNKSDFIDEFADEVHGGKVVKWKDDAEKEIRRRIAEQCCLISARRKEWGAVLPSLEESLDYVEVKQQNPEWRAAYDALLEETIERIKQNEKLMKQMQDDDMDEMDLAGALNPYLARLEAFMTAPEVDELGAKIKGIVGPKVGKVKELVQEHIAAGMKGKILIITNYHASATSLYENLPPDLKKRFIRYHAENKDRDIAKFKRDDNIIGMIGVEESLGTGHNFQFCSRIIRIETKWNPGDLEQANARIWRPDLKSKEIKDKKVYINWVVVDQTIDVCKFARLISKVVSKVKFDEADNPRYAELESLPIIKMNLDTLRTMNSVHHHLFAYVGQYATYKSAYNKEMREYKQTHGKDFALKPIHNDGKHLEGDGLMRHTTYVPEMYLPDLNVLGIVRYSDYVDDHAPEGQGIDDYDTEGLHVHTEFGDGVIVSSKNRFTLRVKMPDQSTITVKKLKTFIIPNGKAFAKSGESIRDRLAKVTGLTLPKLAKGKKLTAVKPMLEEDDAPAPSKKAGKAQAPAPAPKNTKKKKEEFDLPLYVESMYDQITLGVYGEEVPEDAVETLEAHGFRFTGPYIAARITTKQQMRKFVDALTEKYHVEPTYRKRMEESIKYFNQGPKNAFNARAAMKAIDMKNFWRMKRQKADKGTVRPYTVVHEGEMLICMAITSMQPSNKMAAKTIRVPGVKWLPSDGEYVAFYPNKSAVTSALNQLASSGIHAEDPSGVKAALSKLKVHTVKEKSDAV